MKRATTTLVVLVLTLVGSLVADWRLTPLSAAAAVSSPVLFVAAHPDDETLAMGVAIAEHVAAGQDVHILWLTDGEASSALAALNGAATSAWWPVRHDPTGEGYLPLTAATMSAARVREASTAVACLSAGMAGSLTVHRAHLPDGGVTAGAASAAILTVADTIAPNSPVRLKTHTWRSDLDGHPDHLAAGQAVLALGAADPVRFGDRRYYLLPRSTVPAGITTDSPTDAAIRNRVLNGLRSYEAWQPAVGAYAVGGHSVGTTYIATLRATVRSLYHA